MHIIGTAGHVDHGKSALVQALTGTNPDRWLEEQQRGMTLDLGFAHLAFEDGAEAGIIDVPGHERFLHNMLAGAAGMELLLLVVAANEGVMPQTIEHLQILAYLNVREVIVVLTKSDLVSEKELSASTALIQDALRGTIAEGATYISVSNTQGTNIEMLRQLIRRRLGRLNARDDAPAYLPIDRVFALPGRGTIVTGTLMQGRIATGDRLVLQPSGKEARMRSLQTFGQTKESVSSGARVAANLPGIEVGQIARGEVLVAPELGTSDYFRVRFEPLDERVPLLRKRTNIRAYLGSAEILGTLILNETGTSGALEAELSLRKPTAAYPGSPFVLRMLSPKILLGGGTIEGAARSSSVRDNFEPHRGAVLAQLRGAKLAALTSTEVAQRTNLREPLVARELGELLKSGEAFGVQQPQAYVAADQAEALLQRVLAYLTQFHTSEPWAMGATSVAISRTLELDERTLVRLLDLFAREGRIAHRAGYYSRTDHEPRLAPEQKDFFERILPIDRSQPLMPAQLLSALAEVKASRVPGIGKAFDTLLAKGSLVKVNGDIYRRSQIATIRARVEKFLNERGRMTMAEFRDLIGTSRKYAVPLLEWFDRSHFTVRDGDYRSLAGKR